jgi:hypothetical protein
VQHVPGTGIQSLPALAGDGGGNSRICPKQSIGRTQPQGKFPVNNRYQFVLVLGAAVGTNSLALSRRPESGMGFRLQGPRERRRFMKAMTTF